MFWYIRGSIMVEKFLTIGTQLQHMFQMRCYSVGTNLAYIYRPVVEKDKKMPLLIMLHGATQSALEFSGQTQMNKLADKYGFCVAFIDTMRKTSSFRLGM